MSTHRTNQNRTAIVYFGATKADYLNLVAADDHHQAYIAYIQKPLQAQISKEQHRADCADINCYTVHSQRTRRLRGWGGEIEELPICRAKCRSCKAVFTVLPSFIARYRRQDTDCLGKLLEMNLGMGLSQRETATIYEWNHPDGGWHPGGVWQARPMVRQFNAGVPATDAVGPNPPAHILSDEKFATLNGEQIYLFLLSQEELIWYAQWIASTDESAFCEVIVDALGTLEAAGQREALWSPDVFYTPKSATLDGWKPAQTAWQTLVPGINLIECNLHGRKRVDATLKDFAQAHPDSTYAERQQLKADFDQIFEAPSLAAFSQRVRRMKEKQGDEPILLKRLDILTDKRVLFTNHLKFESAPAFSAALDRSMRFLDEKLLSFGQFRAIDSIDPMLNAWAIVNNLRAFLPGAKKAGQSLAQFFGAQLYGLPWMEALNLCSVAALANLIPDLKIQGTNS